MKPPATNHQNAVTATILTSSPNPKAQLHPSSYGVSPSVQSKSSSLQQHYQNQSQLSETSSLSSSGCGGLADSGRGGSSFLTSTNGGGTGSTASSITSVGRRDPSTASGLTWSKTGTTGNDSSLLDSDEDDEEEEEEEDDFESSSHESLRDAFWESILKEPGDRTEEDIQILMDNVQQLPAFSNLTKATCRALCSIMLVAVVHEAGQVVLTEDEKLDTWSVVLNGTVEVIEPDGTIRELTRGDAFGVRLDRPDRVLHRGTMRTVTEDCQFVWVPQADYMQIMSREGEAEIPEVEEGGRVVLVYETLDPSVGTGRTGSNGGTAVAPNRSLVPTKTVGLVDKLPRVVTKGTPEKLIEHLIADLSNLDITYPEDFLLTYRTFLDSPRPIVDRLLSWHLHSPKLRARVNRIILLWVHNHFNDFEDSVEMMRFVEKFDEILSKDGTAGERRLFQLACSTKARVRHVEFDLPPVCAGSSPTLTKLPFTLIGGQDGWGIFINQVDPRFLVSIGSVSYPSNGSASCIHQSQTSLTSIASLSVNPSSRSHLRRADQLLTVNGRSVEHMTPHEVIQLIQSGRALSNSTTTTPNSSTTTDQYGSAVTGVSGEAGCTAVNSSATTCTIHLLVVFNPVQYHQLISTLDYSLSMESDQGTSSQTTHPDGPRKITLPKSSSISAGLGSGHALNASPVPTAYQRGRVPGNLPRRLPSQDRGSSVVSIHPTLSGTPGSIRPDPTRPRSAQNSPTRSTDTGPSKACSRERPGAFPIGRSGTIAAGDEPKFSVSPTRLNVHPTHRPQRSSSQPDLLTLDVLAGSSVNGTCGPLPPVSHVTSDGLPYTAVSGPSGRDSNCSSVIRVWRAADAGRDQTSKLVLLPRKQTTALEATRLALEEFGLPEDDLDSYCLYHVSEQTSVV
ncbi:Rap guanine nucleotide exchange factor 2 [Fasciola gigantica]|uniref:Rap guanine nucleotide exchange factor 2 n=1 Tax=Fasciola gigantica TaxID=46835 RepID=A0A504YRX0_FASGI|nr:Rap guanine nucleotide exchange factor 2 [Fasciola gigantica]